MDDQTHISSVYHRWFGGGPLGCLVTGLCVLGVFLIERQFNMLPCVIPTAFRWLACCLLVVIGVGIALWAYVHLPVTQRGQSLVQSGPYRFVRHPLYSLVIVIVPILSTVWFQSGLYLLLFPVLWVLWRILVKSEEAALMAAFGDDFESYRRRTGYFFPKWNSATKPPDDES